MVRKTAERRDAEMLERIQRRVLWLATRIIDHANRERTKTDGLKVGGHQASSASLVSVMTALWFSYLRREDRVSVKPHASPVLHALSYLTGNLDRSFLTQLRSFGGLQAYPSRTKDHDRVDFSTGSVGLGAVAPLFAAATRRYVTAHGADLQPVRYVAIMGDAELDEGNVWEAIADPVTDGLDNVLWVVDLNRQSLDRVVPGIKAARWRAMFEANGWNVIDVKYGRRLRAAFEERGGDVLRRHIDDMPNEVYQSLFGLADGELRTRFLEGADPEIKQLVADLDEESLRLLVTDLGGHDIPTLVDAFHSADACTGRPSVVFAYTVKGWGLPLAGDPMNHAALLTAEQIAALRAHVGLTPENEWDRFPDDSPEARWCEDIGRALVAPEIPAPPSLAIPDDLGIQHPAGGSTQSTFGRILSRITDVPEVASRIVTTSPDVSVSTNLSGWINKRGVFAPVAQHDFSIEGNVLRWAQSPSGQHLELGISEMNLFSLLGQLGLSHELSGSLLLPIGTVYDPFVCRGLDALIYALYAGARFIMVGTPSGITLSPEGGAHQSSITPSIGLELPGIDTVEPAYGKALEWLFCDALQQVADREEGRSTYFRLTTRPIDQAPFERARETVGDDRLRADVLAGAYLLRRTPRDAEYVVNIVACGAVVPEAWEAAGELEAEGVGVNLIDVTSADRLHREWVQRGRRTIQTARVGGDEIHLARLLSPEHRRIPLVTVHDAAPHALAWIGSVFGAPVVPLGVDDFGQSGTIADLYQHFGLTAASIVNAALLALD